MNKYFLNMFQILFFSVYLSFFPLQHSFCQPDNLLIAHQLSVQPSIHAAVFLFQPESMEAGDDEALKPYEGFNIISILALLLTVALVVFLVFKVMKGMNRKEEE
jgi:hypothetical protein